MTSKSDLADSFAETTGSARLSKPFDVQVRELAAAVWELDRLDDEGEKSDQREAVKTLLMSCWRTRSEQHRKALRALGDAHPHVGELLSARDW